MRAGIIAAGEGSRIKSDGIQKHKPLVSVGGVPIIERLISAFIANGLTDITCIVNEESLDVREFVQARQFPIPVRFVVKSTPSSMHSLFAIAPYLMDGQFLLSTVDSIFLPDEFAQFLAFACSRESSDGVLAVTRFVDDENPLYVQLDNARRILGFSKANRAPWVTGGLYVFSPRIFREIDNALTGGISRLRNFLAHLVTCGYLLEAFPFSTIVDVDHARDISVAEELLQTGGGARA